MQPKATSKDYLLRTQLAKFHFLDICWGPNWPHFLIFQFILFLPISFFGRLGRGGGFRDNNFSKQCQIELTFCPQIVLVVVQMLFKRFWKALVFTENFKSTQSFEFSVQVRPQFTSWRWPSGYPSKSKSRPYLLSIFIENYHKCFLHLCFFGYKGGPLLKIKRSQLRLAPLFQKPLSKG